MAQLCNTVLYNLSYSPPWKIGHHSHKVGWGWKTGARFYLLKASGAKILKISNFFPSASDNSSNDRTTTFLFNCYQQNFTPLRSICERQEATTPAKDFLRWVNRLEDYFNYSTERRSSRRASAEVGSAFSRHHTSPNLQRRWSLVLLKVKPPSWEMASLLRRNTNQCFYSLHPLDSLGFLCPPWLFYLISLLERSAFTESLAIFAPLTGS